MIAVIGVDGKNTGEISFHKWLEYPINIDTTQSLILYIPTFLKSEIELPIQKLKTIPRFRKLPYARMTVIQIKTESRRKKYEDVIIKHHSFFKHIRYNIIRLLESGKSVIGIGFLQEPPEQLLLNYDYEFVQINKFIPILNFPHFDEVQKYIEQLTLVQGCLIKPHLTLSEIESHLHSHYGLIEELGLNKSLYFETENHRAVAVGLRYSYKVSGKGFDSGEFILIPSMFNTSPYENIRIALECFFGIELTPKQLPWVNTVIVAGQEQIEEKLEKSKISVTQLEQEIESIEAELKKSRKCVRLLYSYDNDLVDAVKEGFLELGFKWPEHCDVKQEDSFLEFEDHKAVLEISGTKGGITIKKLRQCFDWVAKYGYSGDKPKGIFVINPWREAEPSTREEVKNTHPDVVEFAKREDIAILLTKDLYNAINSKRKGEFNLQEFAVKLFNCNGLFGS